MIKLTRSVAVNGPDLLLNTKKVLRFCANFCLVLNLHQLGPPPLKRRGETGFTEAFIETPLARAGGGSWGWRQRQVIDLLRRGRTGITWKTAQHVGEEGSTRIHL